MSARRPPMPRLPRLGLALAAGGVVATLAYPSVRLLEALLFPQANPVSVVWLSQSAFAARVLLAAHFGALGAFGGFALVSRSPRAFARWLAAGIPLAASLLVAQAVVWP